MRIIWPEIDQRYQPRGTGGIRSQATFLKRILDPSNFFGLKPTNSENKNNFSIMIWMGAAIRHGKSWRQRRHTSRTIRTAVINHQDCCQVKQDKIHGIRKEFEDTLQQWDIFTLYLLRGSKQWGHFTTVRPLQDWWEIVQMNEATSQSQNRDAAQ